MTNETKNNNSLLRILGLIGIVIIAGVTVKTLNNQNASENDNESGSITESENLPFSEWFGKPAPDFTVTDIEGKQHSISDYLGKNLLVNIWATWCPPCRAEIPHFIELRKQVSEEDLAILAISTESNEDVKKFVDTEKINYTVAALGDSYLPSPFIDVVYIPTTFFIDKKGNIKTVKIQSLTLEQINGILKAETPTDDNKKP